MWKPGSSFRIVLGYIAMGIIWAVGPSIGTLLWLRPDIGLVVFAFLSIPVRVLIGGDRFGNVILKDRLRQVWCDPAYKELKLQTIIMMILMPLFILVLIVVHLQDPTMHR